MSEDKEKRELSGYERMLARVREIMEQAEETARPAFTEALERVKKTAVDLEELTRDEAERIAKYLQRDVEDAARTSAEDQDLKTWFRMDLQLIEDWIWDHFSSVADKTRLEMIKFNASLKPPAGYHTGEITAPGVLTCTGCGAEMHFKKAGHIPPCPSCKGTTFTRAVEKSDTE